MDMRFFAGKRIFITGHTGFKGSWLCRILLKYGAIITGYSLLPPTKPNLFSICSIEDSIHSIIGDVRDRGSLMRAFSSADPEIVIHMAAQPLVRESYQDPAGTYETNVMGTVNILECVRTSKNVRSFLNVTTDKVYLNREWVWGYRENDPLDGYDPYSNSKSCSELITHSYKNSFFMEEFPAISTARAGNVIGGGDFATDRIIPDCVRAVQQKTPVIIRNPYSERPYQHVLEPLFAYLLIVQKQWEDPNCAGWYNVGPDDTDCITTGELVDLFCEQWGKGLTWVNKAENGPHEANLLKLDCSKIKSNLGWKSRWGVQDAVKKTVEWTQAYLNDGNMGLIMDTQICDFNKLEK